MVFAAILGFPIVLGGLYYFFSPAGRTYRIFGWIYVSVLVLLIGLRGKPYYLAPLLPVMLAGGAVWLEQWTAQRHWFRARRVYLAAIVALGIVAAPISLPLLPPSLFAQHQDIFPTNDMAEMFGWPELVATVGAAYAQLPPGEQAQTAIITSNYGSASAIDLYGTEHNLPAARSGHNSYYFWGPGDGNPTTAILVGFNSDELNAQCGELAEVGVVTNDYGVQNDEYGRAIYLCRQLQQSLHEVWPQLKHFE